MREAIKEILDGAKRPAMLCSFGKDSMLLLSLLREITDITKLPLLWFRADRTAKQLEFGKRIIRDWNLQAFSYYPADRYFTELNGRTVLVDEYAFGQHRHANVVEAKPRPLSAMRTPEMSHVWDVIFHGGKDSDEIPPMPDGSMLGAARFYAPLRTLSDEDVWGQIHRLSVPYDELRYSGDDSRDDGVLEAAA